MVLLYTAENGCDQIELEQADHAPIQGTNNYENQCKRIHRKTPFLRCS